MREIKKVKTVYFPSKVNFVAWEKMADINRDT
jgi:hypothetical protein